MFGVDTATAGVSPSAAASAASFSSREISSTASRLARASASADAAGTRDDIERFLRRPESPQRHTPPLPAPACEPIGGQIR